MLFKLSTRVRGSGNVGEMSMLINRAFEVVAREAGKAKLSFLIIDEADSLAGSRTMNQSHHEDKVAVNTLIQKIDDVRRYAGRVLVFLCTNHFDRWTRRSFGAPHIERRSSARPIRNAVNF
jgi:SpoVK/Ycf46/Vps4 family AAA+-type ATPase